MSMTTPEHYSPVMPYMILTDADGFIKFIETVFDAEEKLRVDRDDGSVMHGEYSINGGTVMFGQATDQWPPFPCGMFVIVDDVDGRYKKGVANGAAGILEPDDRGYGRTAGFVDSWGNQWWLNDPGTGG